MFIVKESWKGKIPLDVRAHIEKAQLNSSFEPKQIYVSRHARFKAVHELLNQDKVKHNDQQKISYLDL